MSQACDVQQIRQTPAAPFKGAFLRLLISPAASAPRRLGTRQPHPLQPPSRGLWDACNLFYSKELTTTTRRARRGTGNPKLPRRGRSISRWDGHTSPGPNTLSSRNRPPRSSSGVLAAAGAYRSSVRLRTGETDAGQPASRRTTPSRVRCSLQKAQPGHRGTRGALFPPVFP
jgi:hypothetical protein